MLNKLGVPYVVNPHLVRGLDYYCQTVFEWVSTVEQSAQSVVCAGGHYDGLVTQMGGRPTPAIGFAIGLERLLAISIDNIQLPSEQTVYLVLLGAHAMLSGVLLAETIRKSSKVNIIVNCGGGTLSTQLKRADKSKATIALIMGDVELARGEVLIKYLREDKPQENIKLDDINNFLNK